MLFVLAFPALPPAAAERVEAFRRRHEPERAALVPAHLTLVFGLQRVAAEELIGRAAGIAAGTAPFAAGFDAAIPFADPARGEHKLFLTVGQGAGTLTRLHAALYAGDPTGELRADPPFRPHLTIATADGPGGIAAACRDAAALDLPLHGRIEALQVTALRDGRLQALADLPLGGSGRSGGGQTGAA